MRINEVLLFEGNKSTITISDIFTSEELKKLEQDIKNNKDMDSWFNLAIERIRKLGLNATKNIHVFNRAVHRLKKKYHPEQYETPKGAFSDEWYASYGKARWERSRSTHGKGPTGSRNWTGD